MEPKTISYLKRFRKEREKAFIGKGVVTLSPKSGLGAKMRTKED